MVAAPSSVSVKAMEFPCRAYENSPAGVPSLSNGAIQVFPSFVATSNLGYGEFSSASSAGSVPWKVCSAPVAASLPVFAHAHSPPSTGAPWGISTWQVRLPSLTVTVVMVPSFSVAEV